MTTAPQQVQCLWNWCPAQCPSCTCSPSVQLSDDYIDICATVPWVSQVLQEPSFVFDGVTSHWQPERQQEVIGSSKVLPNRVDLMNQVLQADDSLFTCRPRKRSRESSLKLIPAESELIFSKREQKTNKQKKTACIFIITYHRLYLKERRSR